LQRRNQQRVRQAELYGGIGALSLVNPVEDFVGDAVDVGGSLSGERNAEEVIGLDEYRIL
jgi:hypothetical protein